MEQAGRRRKTNTRAVHELEEVHQALVALHDEYTETTAWTALVCKTCSIKNELNVPRLIFVRRLSAVSLTPIVFNLLASCF